MKLLKKWEDRINLIIDCHDNAGLYLTKKEIEFIDSIEKKVSEGKELTWKQSKHLNEIYERVK